MMRDMALPAVERDALIERITAPWAGDSLAVVNTLAERLLAAIEEQYVLIPKDQVTVERWVSPSDSRARLTTEWRAVSE